MKVNRDTILVDTPKIDGVIRPIQYMRTEKGSIDLAAYKSLKGKIVENGLEIDVEITDARIRYGHLDLCVTPISGTGTVWVERKNIEIPDDVSMKPGSKSTKKSKLAPNQQWSADELQELIRSMINAAKNPVATF